MDYFSKISEMQEKKRDLLRSADEMIEAGKFGEELKNVQNEIARVAGEIDQVTSIAAASASGAKEEKPGSEKGKRLFANLGEQLRAVRNAANGAVDERLLAINNAAKGANTTVGADGGYAMQEDFAGAILESAAQSGEILSRVNRYTVGANSNSVRWVAIDEQDVSSSVYGGVQMYWASEGGTVNATKPKFREVKCDLEKMMGFAYVTSEMLEDTSFMSSFVSRCFALAAQRMLEGSIISGTGEDQPLGILSSSATVKVPKVSGQDDGTITAENVLDMWQRGHFAYRNNMVWLAHPDCEAQLQRLEMNGESIWMPEGGISASPYQKVLGRPVVYTDQCSALGTAGDIVLADLSKYTLVQKGSARSDWSMHVEFLTDQQCFRMVMRVNGRPEPSSPIQLKNTTLKRSPFVTLEDRKAE